MENWSEEWPLETGWYWFYGITHKCQSENRLSVVYVCQIRNPQQPPWCVYIADGANVYKAEGARGVWQSIALPALPQVGGATPK